MQQCYRAKSTHSHTLKHTAQHIWAHSYTPAQFLHVKMTQVKWRGPAHTPMPPKAHINGPQASCLLRSPQERRWCCLTKSSQSGVTFKPEKMINTARHKCGGPK